MKPTIYTTNKKETILDFTNLVNYVDDEGADQYLYHFNNSEFLDHDPDYFIDAIREMKKLPDFMEYCESIEDLSYSNKNASFLINLFIKDYLNKFFILETVETY